MCAQSISCTAGDWRFAVEGERLHSICWRGVEIVRGLSAPVRDLAWGARAEIAADPEVVAASGQVRVTRRFRLTGGDAEGSLSIIADAEGDLTASWELAARRDVATNRAGLCVLHPLAGVQGRPFQIVTPSGAAVDGVFPSLIAPAQPARDIAMLRHEIAGVCVQIRFEGEVFEMEDQRNWSDASYKTYCRPLAAPKPYEIKAGETARQSVRIRVSGAPGEGDAPAAAAQDVVMPEILLAAAPGWLGGPGVPGAAHLARFAAAPWAEADLAALAGAPLDAEFVTPDGAAPGAFLKSWAERLQRAGLRPRHVLALPETYLKSHQPEGPWPAGPTPADCAAAAQDAFASARIGMGVLTNFTELNRLPPASRSGRGAYVSHGNSAIVHAADDLSVLQTLEAFPSICRSARMIGGERAYRLGLCAIAMRTNPYGPALADNPDGARVTMTDADPRQGDDFAAAYAIGVAAQAALGGAEAVGLGARSGPFSIAGPLAAAIAGLAAMAGRSARVEVDRGRVRIDGASGRLWANAALSPWAPADASPLAAAQWRFEPAEGRA